MDNSPYTYRFWNLQNNEEVIANDNLFYIYNKETMFSPILRDYENVATSKFKNKQKDTYIYSEGNNASLKKCVGLSFTHSHQQQWFLIPCDKTYTYTMTLCEKTLTIVDRATVQLSLLWCPKGSVTVRSMCAKMVQTYFDAECLNIDVLYYSTHMKRFINHWLKNQDILVLKSSLQCSCYSRYNALDKNDPSYSILNSQFYKCECDISDKYLCFFPQLKRRMICPHEYISCDNSTCINMDNWNNRFLDCEDKSDELNCISICGKSSSCHNLCTSANDKYEWLQHQCLSSQLNLWSTFCDGIQHCKNGFDELECHIFTKSTMLYLNSNNQIKADDTTCKYDWSMCNDIHNTCFNIGKQCLFERDIYGDAINCANTEHLRHCHPFECPNHYKCSDSYCIPIHTVCDGVPDCPSAEDESQCPLTSCPGLLKCKHDNICVHPDFICDQVIHCPTLFDDEKTCETIVCPKGCHCLSNMILCKSMYVEELLQLRRASSLVLLNVLTDLKYMYAFHYLIHIKITSSKMTMPLSLKGLDTLRFVNISFNNISLWTNTMFHRLYSLKTLDVSHNIFTTITHLIFSDLLSLLNLHITNCHLQRIEACSFCSLAELKYLNMEHNSIKILNSEVFNGLQSVQYISLVENNFEYLHTKVFNRLTKLVTIETNDANVCCFMRKRSVCKEIPLNCLLIKTSKLVDAFLVILIIIIIPSNLYAIVHNATISKKNTHFFVVKALAFHELLIVIFVGLIFYIQTLPSSIFIFVRFKWFQSFTCKANKFILLYSMLMSKIFVTILAIDALILTKFVMKKQSLKKSQIRSITFVSGVLSFMYSLVYVHTVKNYSILCFPFQIQQRNLVTIALCSFWCFINILFLVIIIYCYTEVIRAILESKKLIHRNKLVNKAVIIKSLILVISNTLPTISLTTILFLQMINSFHITFRIELSIILLCVPYNYLVNAMLQSVSMSQVLRKWKRFSFW